MKPFLRSQLERYAQRLGELDFLLSREDIMADMAQYRVLSREHAEVTQVAGRYARFVQCEADLAGAREMLADPEMAEMAQEEITAASAELLQLEDELQRLLLPKDPDDARNAFVEIRAGTGGDESALFAGDLTRMYMRYADRVGWKVEVISENAAELGGYKEIVLRIEGDHVYGALKFESGGHRVQRVPATETQGRIHTSACTVAVMPEPDETEAIKLNPADLRIDTFRASGAGGQHINKTDSAVRVVHLPTGIVAECQDGRSQHANKAKALQVLQARIQEKERSERAAKEAAERKGFKATVEEETAGDVAGIKSATIKIEGEYAYGLLRTETGVHRLVRKSPFDSSGGRHTSLASVFVYPDIDDSIQIDINPSDVRTDTYRASGAGGQHINKTDSAVRLTHLPTGIVVQCQDGRSQHGNRDIAWQRLRSKLYDFEMRKRQEEAQKLEDTKTDVGWGHQIRSYVLDNSRIKDLRTNVEISATQKVLDGDLDAFIEASLKQGI